MSCLHCNLRGLKGWCIFVRRFNQRRQVGIDDINFPTSAFSIFKFGYLSGHCDKVQRCCPNHVVTFCQPGRVARQIMYCNILLGAQLWMHSRGIDCDNPSIKCALVHIHHVQVNYKLWDLFEHSIHVMPTDVWHPILYCTITQLSQLSLTIIDVPFGPVFQY